MKALFLLLFFSLPQAWGSPAVNDIRPCSGFHSCWDQECFAAACPVVKGEPVCDMTRMKLPKGRNDPSFVSFKKASRPFAMKASGKAKGTFLLVHGLSDSPYTYGPLAEDLAARGYNSVAILLTGHGADNQKHYTAKDITAEAWQGDLQTGIDFVKNNFKNSPIFLSGFSTGGAIVVLYMLRHKELLPGPRQDPKLPIRGMVLYDPALGLTVTPQALIESSWLQKVVPPNTSEDAALTVGNNPARIPFDTGSIAGGLGQTIKAIDDGISELKIPTLGLFTSGSSNSPDDGGATTILTYRARGKLAKIVPKPDLDSPIDFIQQIHNQILTREELGACVPRIKREGHYVNEKFSRLVQLTADFADKHLKAPEGSAPANTPPKK